MTELFTISGQGIPLPNAPVTVKFTDVEGESARDRSGMLHRTVLRRVKSWEFSYDRLTQQERQHLLPLLTQDVFDFKCPDGETLCYCKALSMGYADAEKGLWRGVRFTVEEV